MKVIFFKYSDYSKRVQQKWFGLTGLIGYIFKEGFSCKNVLHSPEILFARMLTWFYMDLKNPVSSPFSI